MFSRSQSDSNQLLPSKRRDVCITSCALPKGSEALLLKNLPEAVDDSAVCRLAGSGRHLEPGLDDISRGHQRSGWYALFVTKHIMKRCYYAHSHILTAVSRRA